MSCEDNNKDNPLPRLVAIMPSVAESVLNKCVTKEGNPNDKEYQVGYNFRYLYGPHDEHKHLTQRSLAWYCNVSVTCLNSWVSCDDIITCLLWINFCCILLLP